MAMQILDLEIGSPEWRAIRTKYKVASEAPAMMGADPNFKRSDLLHLKSTGVEREISEWTEKFVFKRGHETEAAARPIAEENIGDDLYPVVGVNEVDGLQMLASFDGLTMPLHDLHWEHKQFNESLFAIVQEQGELPPRIYWQLEHQLAVNENDECLFSVSDGTKERYAEMRYRSRPERRKELIAGWKLFDRDLAAYKHEDDLPALVGEVITELPPLDVEVLSEVKRSNLAVYKANVVDFLDRINEDLQTDHDFATAKNVVTFLKEREREIAHIEKRILEGSSTTGETMRTIAQLKEAVRQKRLTLDRLVVDQDKSRRAELLTAGKTEWSQYRLDVEAEIAPYRLPAIEDNFAGAVRNRRTLATYREAVKNEVARLKIAADVLKDKITANIAAIEFTSEFQFLFNDMQELIAKDQEALVAIAHQRIAAYQAEQDAKVKAAAEALAAKTKAEEDAKAAEQAKAKPAAPVAPVKPDFISHTQTRAPGAVIGTRAGNVAKPATIRYATVPQDDLAPPAHDIITAVAVAFSVDNATALEWIAGINIDSARAMIAQQPKGAKVS